jgi:hypothetical protein
MLLHRKIRRAAEGIGVVLFLTVLLISWLRVQGAL